MSPIVDLWGHRCPSLDFWLCPPWYRNILTAQALEAWAIVFPDSPECYTCCIARWWGAGSNTFVHNRAERELSCSLNFWMDEVCGMLNKCSNNELNRLSMVSELIHNSVRCWSYIFSHLKYWRINLLITLLFNFRTNHRGGGRDQLRPRTKPFPEIWLLKKKRSL